MVRRLPVHQLPGDLRSRRIRRRTRAEWRLRLDTMPHGLLRSRLRPRP